MADEQPSRRKPGRKPKGEAAMSGAERTRLYRQRKKAQQAEGLPTQEDWEYAKRVVEVVRHILPRLYDKLQMAESGIDDGDMAVIRSAHWDLKHLTYRIAEAVGAEYSVYDMARAPGVKVWFDPMTKLPKSGREFPEGTKTADFIHVVL